MIEVNRACARIKLAASMPSSDEGEIDGILGGADFEELETMNVSPPQPEGSQEILGVVPALTNDVVNTAGWHPVMKVQGNCDEEALARGLLFLFLLLLKNFEL